MTSLQDKMIELLFAEFMESELVNDFEDEGEIV